jgi:CBS domain-containing protein
MSNVTQLDILRRRVRDVMSTDLAAVNPGDSVSEALRLLVENKVHALPVVDGHERCVGVLSGTDLLQLALQLGGELEALNSSEGLDHELLIEKLEHTGFSTQTVQEVMTPTAVTVHQETSIVQAAAAMTRNRVHRLAVTDAKGRLLGLVSTMDIIGVLAEAGD